MENTLHKQTVRQMNLKKMQKCKEIVVPVLTDQEEDENINGKLIQMYFKNEILQAQMANSELQKILACARYCESAKTYPQKNKIIKQKIRNYFLSKAQIDLQHGHFVPRVDIGIKEITPVYLNKLILFGVDFLNIHQILTNSPIKRIQKKWLDSSHCLLEFAQSSELNSYLKSKMINLGEELMTLHLDQEINEKSWKELKSYEELGFKRRLFARNFTAADQKYFEQQQITRNHLALYQIAKKDMMEYILQDNRIRAIYNSIKNKQYIERATNKLRRPKLNNGFNNNQYQNYRNMGYKQRQQPENNRKHYGYRNQIQQINRGKTNQNNQVSSNHSEKGHQSIIINNEANISFAQNNNMQVQNQNNIDPIPKQNNFQTIQQQLQQIPLTVNPKSNSVQNQYSSISQKSKHHLSNFDPVSFSMGMANEHGGSSHPLSSSQQNSQFLNAISSEQTPIDTISISRKSVQKQEKECYEDLLFSHSHERQNDDQDWMKQLIIEKEPSNKNNKFQALQQIQKIDTFKTPYKRPIKKSNANQNNELNK